MPAQPIRPGTLLNYKEELQHELASIINYWDTFTLDTTYGGFLGAIDEENVPMLNAAKGVVLNSRILWTFSAAAKYIQNPACAANAARAFHYIERHFIDPDYGGVYWTVDYNGNKLDDKKQIYGLAFCLYGMAAYYELTGDEKSLRIARDMYETIEQFSFDKSMGGYIEAFSRKWDPISNPRLSDKDRDEKKTMNTHLHVLEAYTQLYRVWPLQQLEESIRLLLNDFAEHIIDNKSGHLRLFFDEDWSAKDNIISYGHDIEASWLLLEAAEVIRDEEWISRLQGKAILLANAAAEGIDEDGGLWYEVENGHPVRQKHSWPQAEAMVGFFNAWQISGNEKYLEHSLRAWQFTKKYILDRKKGEWFWGVEEDHQRMGGMDKVGIWKCPYHNSRACMEIIRRIK